MKIGPRLKPAYAVARGERMPDGFVVDAIADHDAVPGRRTQRRGGDLENARIGLAQAIGARDLAMREALRERPRSA